MLPRSAPKALVEQLRTLVARLAELPVEAVPADQDLLELGLDSMRLAELAATAQTTFGVNLRIEELFDCTTIEGVAAALASSLETPLELEAAPATMRAVTAPPPRWWFSGPHWLRFLDWPLDLLYHFAATETVVLGASQLDRLPARVIVASSHRSYLDSRAIRAALGRAPNRALRDRLVLLAGGEHLASLLGPWAHMLVWGLGLFPVAKRSDPQASMRQLAQGIDGRCSVLVHPQGTHCDFALEQAGVASERFRPGVALLAREMGVPVLPVGLCGPERLIPPKPPAGFRGRTIDDFPITIRRGRVIVAFGRPVEMGPDESPRAFTARLEQSCFELNRLAEAA